MFRVREAVLTISAGLWLGLASSAMAGDPPAADFETTDCWVPLEEGDDIACGFLSVPLRWEAPAAGRIKLAVAIYPPRDPVPGLAPVIYLSGGPGYPALGPEGRQIGTWRRFANHFIPGRRLIVFDQRGTGLSVPRLDCPDAESARIWGELSTDPEAFGDSRARYHAALGACHARLRSEGHDLTAYTNRQITDDVEGLRRALGLERVVLYGLSYGTRLALSVLRHRPETVAAALLDSPFPPQAMWPSQDGEAFGATLERLFASCAADPRCAEAFPDLRAQLLAVLEKLAAEPLILQVANLESRDPLFARVDHRVFLAVLRNEMRVTGRLPGLPSLIAGLARGEDWRLTDHLENTYYGSSHLDYDFGMTLSVYCDDKVGSQARPSDLDGTGPYPHLGDFVAWAWQRDPCQVWPAVGRAAIDAAPVTSDVPVLLLAGAMDGSTALELAEAAAETLPNGHLFVFPANAHGQLHSGRCPGELLAAFLANPLTRPDPACLNDLRQPSFLALGID